MANKKIKETPKLVVPQHFEPASMPDGGYDLSAKHPVWNPIDRIPLKGLLLGIVNLPSTQANQEHWACYVVRTTAPTMVRDAETGESRVAEKGELVVLTATASLRRLENAANDEKRVFEVYLLFGGKEQTRSGNTVNVFKHMILGQAFARTSEYRLPSTSIAPRLGTGSDGDVPFADANDGQA